MVKDHSDSERGNPLPPYGYSFRLAARVLLYAPSHRQVSTYHGLCCISRGTRKEMFYIATHSTHSVYGYMVSQTYGKGSLR